MKRRKGGGGGSGGKLAAKPSQATAGFLSAPALATSGAVATVICGVLLCWGSSSPYTLDMDLVQTLQAEGQRAYDFSQASTVPALRLQWDQKTPVQDIMASVRVPVIL